VFLFSGLLIGVLLLQSLPLINRTQTVSVRVVLLLVSVAGGYWVLVEGQFVVATVLVASQRKANLAQDTVTSAEVDSVYVLGDVVIKSGPSSRLLWFVTPDGLFQIGLVSLIALGFVAGVREPKLQARISHVHVAGFLCSAVMLRTVLSIPGLFRFRMVAAPLFAFVLGVAMYAYYARNGNGISRGVVLVLVLVAGLCGPLAVSSDIDGLQPHVTDPAKNSLDTAEYAGLRAVVDFTASDQTVSSLHVETRVLKRFGASTSTPSLGDNEIRTDESLFLYRHEWTEHRATYRPPNRNSNRFVFVSEQWLRGAVASQNKVYSTGSVGLTWGNDPYTLTDRCQSCQEGDTP